MKRLILAAALAGTALAGPTLAQTAAPAAPTAKPMRADANGDGVVTRAEAAAAADARFTALDRNRDGKLSADEMPGRRWKRDDSTPRPDAGRPDITREAFRARALERFDRMDANRDGRVDKSEREAMRARGGGRGHHGRGGPGMMLRMADTNRDGVVTREEATAAAQRMFYRFDTNRDGRIDQAEMQAARQGMHDPAGARPAAADTAPPPPAKR